MACTIGPVIPFPVLPAGFSLTPPALPPLPDITIGFCCRQINFTVPPIPLPLPPLVVNPAFIAALMAAMAVVTAYLDAIPLLCPKE